MNKQHILILGSGGREHAIGRKLRRSPECGRIFFAPGNAGSTDAGINISLQLDDFQGIRQFCLENQINLLIPGSEAPLVKGVYDYFHQNPVENLSVLGPSKEGALLEGSKHFAKEFMREFNIPTAAYRSFSASQKEEALAYLESIEGPYVLKADGLAAGKGVIIEADRQNAKAELEAMLDGRFGDASQTVVIEQFLRGIEVSFFVLTDGKDYAILPEAKDYKRIGEGDTGPNTGGMGAVSPVGFVDSAFTQKVEERIILPTLKGLQSRGIDYRGFIFIGLMNVAGDPFVIEYNVRMGDPETQIVMLRLENDLLEMLQAVFNGGLGSIKARHSPEHGVCITIASAGYPGEVQKGFPIKIDELKNGEIFHAGTAEAHGALVTNGGRVLSACALGSTAAEARENAYSVAESIHFHGKTMRNDIGIDLLNPSSL